MKQNTRKQDTRTEAVKSLKKPELCKGHQPHDFVLTFPEHLWRSFPENPSPELLKKYYESEDRRNADKRREDDYMASIGVRMTLLRSSSRYETTRRYQCSQCFKKMFK